MMGSPRVPAGPRAILTPGGVARWARCGVSPSRARLDAVAGIGVSGMVPALLCLDAAGHLLRPSIQQNDARTEVEIEWLRGRLPAADFFAATGQPLSQQLVLPRLLWLRAHEPAVYGRIRRVLGSYDWITHRLTEEWSLERNWALEAGFWDARHDGWYAPALAATEIAARNGCRPCARRTRWWAR